MGALIHLFFDILPKATNKPKGSENSNVRKNISRATPAPDDKSTKSLKKFDQNILYFIPQSIFSYQL